MKKAKLTMAQAKAIEAALKRRDKQALVTVHVKLLDGKDDRWINAHSALNELSVDELCRALYVGYEIIQEDQTIIVTQKSRDAILESFTDFDTRAIPEEWIKGYRGGIKDALQELGITIQGINGKDDPKWHG